MEPSTRKALSNPNTEMYVAYESDVLDSGAGVFGCPENANAFAEAFRRHAGHQCEVRRNRDGRWEVRHVKPEN